MKLNSLGLGNKFWKYPNTTNNLHILILINKNCIRAGCIHNSHHNRTPMLTVFILDKENRQLGVQTNLY